jgi:hypothetical protein
MDYYEILDRLHTTFFSRLGEIHSSKSAVDYGNITCEAGRQSLVDAINEIQVDLVTILEDVSNYDQANR